MVAQKRRAETEPRGLSWNDSTGNLTKDLPGWIPGSLVVSENLSDGTPVIRIQPAQSGFRGFISIEECIVDFQFVPLCISRDSYLCRRGPSAIWCSQLSRGLWKSTECLIGGLLLRAVDGIDINLWICFCGLSRELVGKLLNTSCTRNAAPKLATGNWSSAWTHVDHRTTRIRVTWYFVLWPVECWVLVAETPNWNVPYGRDTFLLRLPSEDRWAILT